jgi:xanthine/uracil permease
MKLKYGLDDIPPIGELLLFGIQWLAIAVPTVIIIGKVVAPLHFTNALDQVVYLQRLFFVTASALLVQLLWGHRLPLIIGPAAVLLVGIVASQGTDINAVYSSIFIGGIILTLTSITGLFGYLRVLFTSRVVATILVLISFTLTPTIMNLIISSKAEGTPLLNLCFALVLVILMFIAGRYLTGIWKSTLIIWAIIVGSILYLVIFPQYQWVEQASDFAAIATFTKGLNFNLTIEPGVLISFLFCFLALSINDLGSIQSVGELTKPNDMHKRISRGISFTGLANALSGIFGVIGPVNFSMSPGVIASTGNASRFTLIPAGIAILILSFMPKLIAFIGGIPSVIIGTTLLYVLCSQISAGLMVLYNSAREFKFESGLVMGLPIMLSIIISFLPGNVLNTFPDLVRPISGNGFVIGVFTVLIMEHIIYKEKAPAGKQGS